MDMCSLGVKEVNEVNGPPNEGSGHKYTRWCLKPHGCVPDQALGIQRKSKTVTGQLFWPLWESHLLPGSSRERQLAAWLWQLGWMAELWALLLPKPLGLFPWGEWKDGAEFPALPWVQQKSSPAWVVFCLCHHSTGENDCHLLQFLSWNEARNQGNKIVSMASQWVRNSVINMHILIIF